MLFMDKIRLSCFSEAIVIFQHGVVLHVWQRLFETLFFHQRILADLRPNLGQIEKLTAATISIIDFHSLLGLCEGFLALK